jgi:CheY-like chemotaxis protein/HPt (histidine-containing phosphotransfer) domain-containing protein
MSDEMSGVYAKAEEELVAELRQEFLDDILESLRNLDVSLDAARNERKSTEEVMTEVRRFALSLRGQAANFGVRLIGTVAHRMEDYLASIKVLPTRGIDDLQVFVDMLIDIVEGRVASDADSSQIVRGLPAKPGFDADDIDVRDVEVMLVMHHGTATHFVEREMQACGYRVTNVTTTFEALPLIVRTKPDMVLISAIMPELTGIDLAIALASMPATRNVPTALITSLDPDDDYLKLLPAAVPVIKKGPSFGDDLADALSHLFIL